MRPSLLELSGDGITIKDHERDLVLPGRRAVRRSVTVAAFAASIAFAAQASAEPRPIAPASTPQLENPRTDYTAYTRPKGRMAVGPLKIEHGIIDEVMVGTYVPPWFAFPVLKVPIPSVYAKLRTPTWNNFTLSIRSERRVHRRRGHCRARR